MVDPQLLAEELLGDDPDVHLTVSGGEPTEQPEAVALLLRAAHERGRTTWVYTGRTLEELLDSPSPALLDLLAGVDVLVDGRYDVHRAGGLAYRGSANQRVIHLTDAIKPADALRGPKGKVQIEVDGRGSLVVVGIPPRGFLSTLNRGLLARGFSVRVRP